jgi:hypothetical protein
MNERVYTSTLPVTSAFNMEYYIVYVNNETSLDSLHCVNRDKKGDFNKHVLAE